MEPSGKRLAVTNPKGATVRIGIGTGAGAIRAAKPGEVFEYDSLVPQDGDTWALLTSFDPKIGKPWRYGKDLVKAYVAVNVNDVQYVEFLATSPVPYPTGTDFQLGYKTGWNECLENIHFSIPARK